MFLTRHFLRPSLSSLMSKVKEWWYNLALKRAPSKQPSIDYLERRLQSFEVRADKLAERAEVYRAG